jgi:5-methylcytosine-specific restriction endonuclease McrA
MRKHGYGLDMYKNSYYRTSGKLSHEEKKKRADTRRRNKIVKEFTRTADLYDYKEIALDALSAAHYGFSVYWDVCSKGHIGEFTLNKTCKTCAKVTRTIRDAKERGTAEVKLTASEKKQISEIYHHSKKLSRETGIEHHVDHIRPLAAGGEHHPSNLRVITARENLEKGSKFNGSRAQYTRKEKKEIAQELMERRTKQLDEVYQKQFETEMNKYKSKHLLARLFSSKPTRKSAI